MTHPRPDALEALEAFEQDLYESDCIKLTAEERWAIKMFQDFTDSQNRLTAQPKEAVAYAENDIAAATGRTVEEAVGKVVAARNLLNTPEPPLDRSGADNGLIEMNGLNAPEPKWMPIEAAPKDCEPVILANFEAADLLTGVPHVWTARFWDEYGDWAEFSHAATNENGEPTHWMPLPQPPALTEKK